MNPSKLSLISCYVKRPFIEPENILILKTIIQEGAIFTIQFPSHPVKLFVTVRHKNEIHYYVPTEKECVLTTAKNKWATLTIHGEATKFHRTLGLYGQSVNMERVLSILNVEMIKIT